MAAGKNVDFGPKLALVLLVSNRAVRYNSAMTPALRKLAKTLLPLRFHDDARGLYAQFNLRREARRKGSSIVRTRHVVWCAAEIADLVESNLCGPGPGEVLVRSEMTAISPGTEQAAFIGLPGASRGFPYIPGYSGVGRIAAIGAGVTGLSQGQLVAGRLRHSKYNTVSADFVFPVPEGTDLVTAAMIELGVIVLQGVRKAAPRFGEAAIVFGCGMIGQIAMRLARLCGAAPIVAVAKSAERRSAALQPDAADQFYTLDQLPQAALSMPLVIEATGAADGLTSCLPSTAPGGRVVLLGSTRGMSSPVPLAQWLSRSDATIIGAHVTVVPGVDSSPGRWSYLDEARLWLALAGSGKLNLAQLVTHRLAPAAVPAFYTSLAAGTERPVGAVIQWE